MSAVAVHLWQSTAFAVCAALLAWLLRRHEARTRHLIWMAASAKFLIPFDLLVGFGQQFAWRTRPIVSLAVGGTLDPTQIASSPLLTDSLAMPERLATPAGASTLQRVLEALPTLLPAVWLVGTLAMLGLCLFRWLRICRMLQTATQLTDGREAGILHRAERAIGIRGVPLLRSTHQLEPAVVGCAEPVIVWPADISARMNDEQIEAILMHELAHVKRHDNLMGLVHMASQAAFWFNPLLWWIGARLVEERERACDEEVVRLGADPHEYAESILRTCEYAVVSPLPCVAGVTGADLKRRVRAIVHHTPAIGLSRATTALLTLAALSAAVVPIAAGALTVREVNVALPAPVPPRIAGTPARQLVTVALRREVRAGDVSAIVPLPVLGSDVGNDAEAVAELRRIEAAGNQTASVPLKFEVASIKLAPPPTGATAMAFSRIGGSNGRFNHAGSIRVLIQQAYQIPFEQQIGGPDWIREDNYLINAKAPDDVPATAENTRQMVRALLADRFRLVGREETHELPVYELVMARPDKRTGASLTPFTLDCSTPAGTTPLPECNRRLMSGRGVLQLRNSPISALASLIQATVRRPVIDKTGLTGQFNADLTYAPEGLTASGVDSEFPELFTALQEQLGLKLESKRAPMKVLVIESIQRPTED